MATNLYQSTLDELSIFESKLGKVDRLLGQLEQTVRVDSILSPNNPDAFCAERSRVEGPPFEVGRGRGRLV